MTTQAVDILIKARDQASAAFGSVGKAAGGMGSILKTAAAAVGGYLSARAILSFAQTSVQAFMEAEKASNGLQSALEILGKASELASMQAFAAEIQRVTTAEDDAVIATMKLGASIGGMSGDTLKQATIAAIGLAKAYGMDMDSAMTLVAKAAQGATGAFSRYGIVFKDGMTDAEKFNQILDLGRQKFAMAEAETQTFAGKLAQLSNAWGNAKEQLGQYIAQTPALVNVMDIAATAMQNFGLATDIMWTTVAIGLAEFQSNVEHFFSQELPTVFDVAMNNKLKVFKNIITNMGIALKNMATGEEITKGFQTEKFDIPKDTKIPNKKTEIVDELEKQLEEKIKRFIEIKSKPFSIPGPAQLANAGGLTAKENKVAAVESRFLTGKTGTTENYAKKTSENTQRQTSILSQILKATQELKKGSPGQPGLAAASLI